MRVIKIGGSLLWENWVPRILQIWMAEHGPESRSVFVCGGGQRADRVRKQFDDGLYDRNQAHWNAIRAMSENANEFAKSFNAELTSNWQSIGSEFHSSRVFDPYHFLRTQEQKLSGEKLPTGWHVTSDSIAARIAQLLDAEELILLKSADPPADNIGQASQMGYVDSFFFQAAKDVRKVVFVNLRSYARRYGEQS